MGRKTAAHAFFGSGAVRRGGKRKREKHGRSRGQRQLYLTSGPVGVERTAIELKISTIVEALPGAEEASPGTMSNNAGAPTLGQGYARPSAAKQTSE